MNAVLSRRTILLAALSSALVTAGAALAADEPVKVVYHLTDGVAQASRAMANIRNHLDADSTVKIIVVANGAGIDFLLEDAKTSQGSTFTGSIGDLSNRGVQFRVCENTLTARDIPKEQVVMEAGLVLSGVAEAARLQAREGFVYLRP